MHMILTSWNWRNPVAPSCEKSIVTKWRSHFALRGWFLLMCESPSHRARSFTEARFPWTFRFKGCSQLGLWHFFFILGWRGVRNMFQWFFVWFSYQDPNSCTSSLQLTYTHAHTHISKWFHRNCWVFTALNSCVNSRWPEHDPTVHEVNSVRRWWFQYECGTAEPRRRRSAWSWVSHLKGGLEFSSADQKLFTGLCPRSYLRCWTYNNTIYYRY